MTPGQRYARRLSDAWYEVRRRWKAGKLKSRLAAVDEYHATVYHWLDEMSRHATAGAARCRLALDTRLDNNWAAEQLAYWVHAEAFVGYMLHQLDHRAKKLKREVKAAGKRKPKV